MEYVSQVDAWIQNNTKNNETVTSHFTTDRDSKSVALLWRTELDISIARTISEMCSEEMQMLGYLPVREKLDNSTSVITEMPI